MQKTPEQVNALEDAFQTNKFPSEEEKKELALTVDLTYTQVSTWFNHRRRKERQLAAKASLSSLGEDVSFGSTNKEGNYKPDTDAKARMAAKMLELRKVQADPTKLSIDDQKRLKEHRDSLRAAQQSLPIPYREDGPPLGFLFDEVPSEKLFDEIELKSSVQNKRRNRSQGNSGHALKRARLDAEHKASMLQKQHERLLREQQKVAARIAKEHEREVLRLEAERRKQYERMMRERKKEEERLLRERRKEEQRRAKEEARLRLLEEREQKRLALLKEKEMKAEARRQEKLIRQKERELLRRSARPGTLGDTELEWEALMRDYRLRNSIPIEIDLPGEGCEAPEGFPPLPSRPQFPPIELKDAHPKGMSNEIFGKILCCWSILHNFADVFGFENFISIEELSGELQNSHESSQILSQIHISLLRLLQVDAEEAHATKECLKDADIRAFRERILAGIYDIHTGAWLLEEALAWGFDVDAWRANLNPITWPEVAREMAIAAGLGRRRPHERKRRRNLPVHHNLDGRMGTEGEDLVKIGDKYTLQLPERLAANTLKGAAWLVLKDVGYEGLRVDQIAEFIKLRGLRDLSSSKTPDTSINGSLAKDVLFVRIAPATFALQSIREHYDKLGLPGPSDKGKQTEDGDRKDIENETRSENEEEDGNRKVDIKVSTDLKEEEDENNDEEEDAEDEARQRRDAAHTGEPWVASLYEEDYHNLSLENRVALLYALCQLALESPTLKEVLDARSEEQNRIRKLVWEENRAEGAILKHLRLQEQADKNRAEVDEAKRRLDMIRGLTNGVGKENELNDEPSPGNDGNAEENNKQNEVEDAAKTNLQSLNDPTTMDEASIKKRSHLRQEALKKEKQANAIRMEPIGLDRRYNRYWFLAWTIGSGKDRETRGKLFIESDKDGSTKVLESQTALNNLMQSLNRQWPREGALYSALSKYADVIVASLGSKDTNSLGPDTNSKACNFEYLNQVSIAAEQKTSLDRKELQDTIAKFSDHNSPVISKLKLKLLSVAHALPQDAFLMASTKLDQENLPDKPQGKQEVHELPGFDLKSWQQALIDACDLLSIRSCLAKLETAIRAEYLHPDFPRRYALVRGAWIPIGEEADVSLPEVVDGGNEMLVSPDTMLNEVNTSNAMLIKSHESVDGTSDRLAWLPPTASAIGLRILSLDASLKYDGPESPALREQKKEYIRAMRPGKLPGSKDNSIESFLLQGNGLAMPVLFPPFCYRILFGPRIEFTFPAVQFETDVQNGNDAAIDPGALGLRTVKAVGNFASRGRGRGGPKSRSMRAGGTGGPGAGRRGVVKGQSRLSVGPGRSSAASRDRDDEDRHYGTDFEEADQMEEDEDIARQLAPEIAAGLGRSGFQLQSGQTSIAQSTGPDEESSASEPPDTPSSSEDNNSDSDYVG